MSSEKCFIIVLRTPSDRSEFVVDEEEFAHIMFGFATHELRLMWLEGFVMGQRLAAWPEFVVRMWPEDRDQLSPKQQQNVIEHEELNPNMQFLPWSPAEGN